MYTYTDFDAAFVAERNRQFRAQVERRIDGSLTEDEFKPLRLMNGLYLQLHAYMLRVAIPYGTLSSRQMDQLAYLAEKWDKGYGHFTTRQNIQYNWPELRDVPDMLDALGEVPVPPPTRLPTRAPWPNWCASGPPITQNSSRCRASSRWP